MIFKQIREVSYEFSDISYAEFWDMLAHFTVKGLNIVHHMYVHGRLLAYMRITHDQVELFNNLMGVPNEANPTAE